MNVCVTRVTRQRGSHHPTTVQKRRLAQRARVNNAHSGKITKLCNYNRARPTLMTIHGTDSKAMEGHLIFGLPCPNEEDWTLFKQLIFIRIVYI